MAAQIQGRDIVLKIFLNGEVIQGITAKKFNYEGDDEIRKRDLLGANRSTAQTIVDGYKGTIEFDISSKRHHEVGRFINESDKSGVPNYEFAIQVTENYRDGSSHRYRFVRVTFRLPKSDFNSRKDDASGSFEFWAEDKVDL